MGVTFQQKPGAGAPDVADGLQKGVFVGISEESHPDWAGTDKFGKEDTGDRWRFAFNLVDEDGDILYEEGDPIEVDALTRTTVGKKSAAYAILKGIMTAAELAIVDAQEPFDGTTLEGRKVMVVIEHNDKGWPKVVQVVAMPVSAKKAAK